MIACLVNLNWKPVRVVVDADGYALPPEAASRNLVESDIIFVRKDGWSLGAPIKFEDIAYNMWRDEWVQFTRKGDKGWTDISEYHR